MASSPWRVGLSIWKEFHCDLTEPLRAMVAFCTFGVVQSFGVYQDYYTVSYPFLRHIRTLIDRVEDFSP